MNEKSYLRNLGILQTICFVAFLSILMLLSLPGIIPTSFRNIKNASLDNLSETLDSIQDDYKENLKYKTHFADIASLCDRGMMRIFGDNFQYLKDENGYLHKLGNHNLKIELPKDIIDLHSYALENGIDIPFLYIQNPLRVNLQSGFPLKDTSFMDELAQRSYDMLTTEGIPILEISTPVETTYFKTDMHANTLSQVAAMSEMIDFLEDHSDIRFTNKDLLELENEKLYSKESYLLVGGYTRSIGQYFTDQDWFEMYTPLFDTSFTVEFLDFGVGNTGSFHEIVARYPENINDYTYWITSMVWYSHSLYKIVNNLNPEGPKIIIVGDSAALTGMSYLAMTCSELLIFDPRFSNDIKYANKVQMCMGDYDAVIFDTLENSMDEFSIFEQIDFPDQMVSEYKEPISYFIDEFDGRATNGNFFFVIDHDSEYVNMSGWAYDTVNQMGFSQIYLRVGDRMIKCNYGAETIGVFGSELLDHVGFDVQIPMEMLTENTGIIELICQGYDSTWYYTPLSFNYVKTY